MLKRWKEVVLFNVFQLNRWGHPIDEAEQFQRGSLCTLSAARQIMSWALTSWGWWTAAKSCRVPPFFLPNCWAKEWYTVLWAVWWTRALCSGRSQHWESRSGLQLVQDVGKQGGMGRGALGPCTALRWRSLSDIWDDWGGPVSGSGSGSRIDDWKLQAVATQLRTELR